MTQYIDKAALVAEIEKRWRSLANKNYKANGKYDIEISTLLSIKSFIDTLEVKDPYGLWVQYPSVKDAIQAHAETYSFNIESRLFHQLTKEQQELWRKEIEQAYISGGEVGVELARDTRYKENLEVKEVELNDEKCKDLNDDGTCMFAANKTGKVMRCKYINCCRKIKAQKRE